MNLTLSVRSLSKDLFEGKVDSVKLPGKGGLFEVRRGHAPIIASLGAGRITYQVGKKVSEIAVVHGIVKVSTDQVSVWLWGKGEK